MAGTEASPLQQGRHEQETRSPHVAALGTAGLLLPKLRAQGLLVGPATAGSFGPHGRMGMLTPAGGLPAGQQARKGER